MANPQKLQAWWDGAFGVQLHPLYRQTTTRPPPYKPDAKHFADVFNEKERLTSGFEETGEIYLTSTPRHYEVGGIISIGVL